MKKSNTYRSIFSLSILLVLVFLFSSSCHRNKDCDLVVNVIDGTTNGPIVGATVHIYPNQSNSNGNLQIQDQTATTDASGVATFTFKLPAILSADVIPDTTVYGVPPTTLIKLEEGKSVTKAIKCY